ncbi:KH domain-containing protein [Granulicella sibirica]|nr:KH domain-containing protein [Granulicella sibirica]
MKTLVYELVVCLVDKPNEVSIQAVTNGEVTSLRVRVAPEDVGKLVGKQGRTARSLRTILSAASMTRQQRFSLDILEERSTP